MSLLVTHSVFQIFTQPILHWYLIFWKHNFHKIHFRKIRAWNQSSDQPIGCLISCSEWELHPEFRTQRSQVLMDPIPRTLAGEQEGWFSRGAQKAQNGGEWFWVGGRGLQVGQQDCFFLLKNSKEIDCYLFWGKKSLFIGPRCPWSDLWVLVSLTNKLTLLKLYWVDSGWWSYQLNTNW